MRPFAYVRAEDAAAAVQAAGRQTGRNQNPPEVAYLAGGTTLLDLMKLETLRPGKLVDINDLAPQHGAIAADAEQLRLGALVKMSAAEAHPAILRDYPVIAQSLQLAASAQLRNMASLGGNVLQRTRCNYFRDPSWTACNKRSPGSGCAALEGVNRKHAVLGVSEHCIASYPGDFAQALVALDASVEILGSGGRRVIPFDQLHKIPGDRPEVETSLAPGELITGFSVPAGPWTRRSLYLKIRDRQSYEFALTSAAVALAIGNGTVTHARIAVGGVATKPWRSKDAEAALVGQPLTEASAAKAAEIVFASAKTHGENAYKPELGRRTVVRALLQAGRMEI